MIRRDNSSRLVRAESLIREVQQLQVDVSDAAAASAIATKYGNAPPNPSTGNVYPNENCAAKNHLEECSYILALNNNPILYRWLRNPSMRVFRVEDWWGYVTVSVKDRKVSQYSYWLWFRSADEEWRGISGRQAANLPFSRNNRRISNSYDVDYNFRTGMLETSFTPTASDSEQRRATHLELSCIGRSPYCKDACQVMPDASRDFFQKVSTFNVPNAYSEKSLRTLCNTPPN